MMELSYSLAHSTMIPLIAIVLLARQGYACTTILVGKDATTDGSVMCSHSDDAGPGADARILLTPAMHHAQGAMRPIYYDLEDWPHDPRPGQKPIGYIPEVPYTNARYSNTYGMMNDHQVGMGESTCSAVFGTKAVGYGGKALLSIDSLSRIGLERCNTSRCAVSTMGALAEKHGFYGVGSFEGSAESLMVTDTQEAWIFHILPDNTGTSAIWAAQRIEDDKMAVVANMFTIRELNLSDTNHFLASENILDIAQHVLGAWKPSDGLLDFTKVYSDGEYAHLYYSGRRMWGAYNLVAPSLNLPSSYVDLKFHPVYPTAIKPDKKLRREDLFAIHRYYYEGTEFDMTKGLAAGPWGNPDRFNSGSGNVTGNWERSIGLYRTAHTHVVQSRAWLPNAQGGLLWYAPHAQASSCFTPFSAGCLDVAPAYKEANPNVLNRSSIYWAHRIVFNVMHIKYSYMRKDVSNVSTRLEAKSGQLVAELDAKVLKDLKRHAQDSPSPGVLKNLTSAYIENAQNVLKEFNALPDFLITKYADGWIDDSGWGALAYPDEWLRGVGYENGPPKPPCPPCPCTPSTSPQCSACCSQAVNKSFTEPNCKLAQCVSDCDSDSFGYRHCVRECDRLCID